jgi:hypothetical protein
VVEATSRAIAATVPGAISGTISSSSATATTAAASSFTTSPATKEILQHTLMCRQLQGILGCVPFVTIAASTTLRLTAVLNTTWLCLQEPGVSAPKLVVVARKCQASS